MQQQNHTNTFEIFEGRLGGGKTYSATVRILDRLRRGGVVCTNIQLDVEKIRELCASRWGVILQPDKQFFFLDEEQITGFYKHIPIGTGFGLNPLIVMDEFHLWFNARDFGSTDKKARSTLNFITQCRKKHVDLILISQSALNVDKQFVRQLHAIWRFRDMAKWKIPGLGFTPFWLNHKILSCQYDQDGKTLSERFWVKKDPAVFGCYATDSLLRPILDLSENVVDNVSLERVKKTPFLQKNKNLLCFLSASTITALVLFFRLWLNY